MYHLMFKSVEEKIDIPILTIMAFYSLNGIIMFFSLGVHSALHGVFLMFYALISASYMGALIGFIKFLKKKINQDDYSISPEQKSEEVLIIKKYIKNVLVVLLIIFLIPFLVYPIIKILGLAFNFSNFYVLNIYYIVLVIVGTPIISVLKNRVASNKIILNLYNEILNEIPNCTSCLYYMASMYSSKKDIDQCLAFVKRILDIDKNYKESFAIDPVFHIDDLFHSARFQELLSHYK